MTTHKCVSKIDRVLASPKRPLYNQKIALAVTTGHPIFDIVFLQEKMANGHIFLRPHPGAYVYQNHFWAQMTYAWN